MSENILPRLTLNSTQKCLLTGLILIFLGAYGGALGFALVVCGAGLEKGRAERYILCVFSFFIFTLCSVQGVFHTSNFNTLSLFTALCTVMVLFLVDNNSLMLILNKLIFVASVTVPIALIISFSQTLGIYPFEFRSNEVLGVMRFTFLFAEPSHYSILLSLCSLIALVKQTNIFTRLLLLFGLLMTWSLSGFFIFALCYIAYKFYTRGIIKYLIISLFFSSVMVFLWFFKLQYSDFWLVAKIDSIIQLFSGNTVGASSALLRFNSIIIGPYFINEEINAGDFLLSIFGLGFGNISQFVSAYYQSNFGLPDIHDANNIISNVIISSGLVGLFFYILSFIYFTGLNLVNILFTIMILLCLSLFSGYAFGPFAILTLLLSRAFILLVINHDKAHIN
ncbi:hypothetical protein [Escherichia albertii]|uniref:O-antigen polymerase n=1 Tax=Escherichia albertii TaxID=208962 RepID=A0A5A4U635_ESCAL|nr:hypothetical protein [Escherichia albertii]MCE7712165.1 hypothetical protein [Escherichia albertii]MCQ8940842.1 hypothetical protein [Escherichia albertii]MCQ8954109.1 hypothetical protein [Escherichia albertii]MCQ8981287.1 hypothetical protein [Escherichia albertii]MCQ8994300.1 hypothetical protein [Escherichia albertii]